MNLEEVYREWQKTAPPGAAFSAVDCDRHSPCYNQEIKFEIKVELPSGKLRFYPEGKAADNTLLGPFLVGHSENWGLALKIPETPIDCKLLKVLGK